MTQMMAQAAENKHADRCEHHQDQQEPQVRHQLPDQRIVLFVQGQIWPVLRLALDVLQHNELRQRQQRNGGQHGDPHALHAHLPPAFERVAQKQHVREIAGYDKKHLHTEGVNKVIKQRQPPGGHLTINMPGVAGVNQ